MEEKVEMNMIFLDNVYLDGILNNTSIFDTTGYTVYGLNNEIEHIGCYISL